MRVLRRPDPRDDGITTVYVAMGLFLIFGAGAVAVDGGMMWAERRDIVADVDSAVLAAADTHSGLVCDGTATWSALPTTHPAYAVALDFIERNRGVTPAADDLAVERSCAAPDSGKLRVTHAGHLKPLFSAIYGLDDLFVVNESIAQFTPVENGLRPLSICVDDGSASSGLLEQWLASPEDTRLTSSLEKTWKDDGSGLASNCGEGGSGSWGWVCFDKDAPGHSCSASDLADTIANGWPFDVELGAPPEACGSPGAPSPCPPINDSATNPLPLNGWTDYDCKIGSSASASGTNDPCDTTTGAINSSGVQNALDAINCDLDSSGDRLLASPPDNANCAHLFPILGIWEFTGSGSNAVLKPSAFVAVTIRHPTFLKANNSVLSADGLTSIKGKDACKAQLTSASVATWFNDPDVDPPIKNDSCITFQLSGVFYEGGLAEHGFIGFETRLCGVSGDPAGDRCDV